MVLLHRRSRMLLAGDLFYHIATKQGEPPQLSRLPPGVRRTLSRSLGRLQQCLAHAGGDFCCPQACSCKRVAAGCWRQALLLTLRGAQRHHAMPGVCIVWAHW